MGIVLTLIHVIICFALILIVLLQAGKGASLGSAFGGGGASQTAFGTRRGNIMTRTTTVAAGFFMVTSLLLTVIYTHEGSIIKGRRGAEQVIPVEEKTTPPTEKKTTVPTPGKVAPKVEAIVEEGAAPKVEPTPPEEKQD